MIIYFSGTGNTKYCALKLSSVLGDAMQQITVAHLTEPGSSRLKTTDKRVIWMFPTYSWGIPKQIARVMKKAHLDMPEDAQHWMVTTCGDDIGKTADQWRRIMRGRGCRVATAFSVQMPNTYTFMKGFDVDSKEVEQAKLEAAAPRLSNIANIIASGTKVADDVVEGKYAYLKTAIVYRLFNLFCMSPKPFMADDKCTNCGLCMRMCPMENIVPGANNKPYWRDVCMQCSRCYHICAKHAVQYGNATKDKGQSRSCINTLNSD